MKFCLKCNLDYDDKYKFCKKCGSKLINDMDKKSLNKIKNNYQYHDNGNRSLNQLDYYSLFCVALLFIFVIVISFGNFSSNVDSSKQVNPVISHSDNFIKKESVVQPKKKVIPDNFEVVSILGRNIFLPKKFKRITEEEKILDSSPSKHETTGVALYGLVDYNLPNQNDSLNFYEVIVAYSYSPAFHNPKLSVEEKSLENCFRGLKQSISQSTKFELVSKEFCKNIDGHRYLKAKYVVSEGNSPDEKTIVHFLATFYDDKLYSIFLKSYIGTKDKFNNEFEIIFNTFGCDLR